MLNLPALLAHANLVMNNPNEDNVDTFMAYINALPEPDTILEVAVLEVVADLTMHEYLCHEHEEVENG